MQILEKGTTPVCVSNLCSVKLKGAKTHFSVDCDLITLYLMSLNVACDSSLVEIAVHLVETPYLKN